MHAFDKHTASRPLLIAVLFVAFLASAPALMASGTSYPQAATPQQDPLLVTKSLKVRVLEVRADQNAIRILDPKTEKEGWLQIDEDTNLRAQDRKAFDGRRKLEFADLQAGQTLRIQHRPQTGEVLKIKVLREKA